MNSFVLDLLLYKSLNVSLLFQGRDLNFVLLKIPYYQCHFFIYIQILFFLICILFHLIWNADSVSCHLMYAYLKVFLF